MNINLKALTLAIIFMLLSVPELALSNGGISAPGTKGGDIFVKEMTPTKNMIVDEEVVIDFEDGEVSATYFVENLEKDVVKLEMIFPIEGECGEKEDTWYGGPLKEKFISSVYLNKAKINTSQIDLSKIKLDGQYKNLTSSSCFAIRFDVSFLPGQNELIVKYGFWPLYQDISSGLKRGFTYSIWPAKNWVNRFRSAKWRVNIAPRNIDVDKLLVKSDFDPSEWRFTNYEISAPGKRFDYGSNVEYTATNFSPDGSVVIIEKSVSLFSKLRDSCFDGKIGANHCDKYLVAMRHYTGNKRCYSYKDLLTDPGPGNDLYMNPESLKYLRNEIFARNGYMFKTQAMADYFSSMPWYAPLKDSVELNAYEKRNVNYIKEIEKYVDSINPKSSDWYEMYFPDFLDDIHFSQDAECIE